jgi:hypothetical protein
MAETATAPASVPAAEPVKVELVDKQGKTRGKNPRDITYKVLSAPPANIKQFMDVTGTTKEAEVCEYLFEGFNSLQYSAASDEIGEFIPDTGWGQDKETVAQFRLAVRNYSKMTEMSIEDAVNLIRPGVEKAYAKRLAAEKEKASTPATVSA